MLSVRGLHVARGRAPVLRGIDLDLRAGEVAAVLGRNGSGRSTLLQALMGLLPWSGSVSWNGHPLAGLPAHAVARLGLGYVPERRDVFAGLTVHQNLLLGRRAGVVSAQAWTPDVAYAQFPELGARRDAPADRLSGGEQQMLALARTLVGGPGLLLLDEPSEGLSPARRDALAACLQRLRGQGVAILLADQKPGLAFALADRALLLGDGRLQYVGTPSGLAGDRGLLDQWLAA